LVASDEDTQARQHALSAAGQAKIEALARALRVDDVAGSPAGLFLSGLVRRMDRHEHDREAPVREVMARLGDRWSTLILLVLSAGTFRHATLRRLIAALSAERAISQRMLTLRLRSLERDGMVRREFIDTQPPGVRYQLTPLGRGLVGQYEALMAWTRAHDAEIRRARAEFAQAPPRFAAEEE
jgi:DNA-binding HxlR family transcriptional regulator